MERPFALRPMPLNDLRELRELGYASKDRALREAAARVDTWMHKHTFERHMMRMQGLIDGEVNEKGSG